MEVFSKFLMIYYHVFEGIRNTSDLLHLGYGQNSVRNEEVSAFPEDVAHFMQRHPKSVVREVTILQVGHHLLDGAPDQDSTMVNLVVKFFVVPRNSRLLEETLKGLVGFQIGCGL